MKPIDYTKLLEHGAESGNPETMRMLLDAGGKVSNNAVHYGIKSGNAEMVRMFVEKHKQQNATP